MVPKDVGQTDLASLRLAMWTFEQDVLQDRNKFTESLRRGAPDEDLPWVEDDRFGISDHESQYFLRPHVGCSALLPALVHPSDHQLGFAGIQLLPGSKS